MPQYTPPPESLDHLNAIQRYMQKGQLDKHDYVYLVIFVALYIHFRPQIESLFRRLLIGRDIKEGEQAQQVYAESKEKAKVGPNAIRGKGEQSSTMGEPVAETTASGVNTMIEGKVSNRKAKDQSGGKKSETEKLMDWDDEPARKPAEGDKSDVTAWLDRWDKEEVL